MPIAVFGMNHACTELENLERLTFSSEEITHSLSLLIREEGIQECAILSTCNRIEVYAVCQEEFPLQPLLRDFMKHAKPAGVENVLEQFYYKEGNKAVEHLFTVSSGLDSLVIGENEIAGQVKKAYRIACDCHTSGMMLNKIFHAAFKISKRVKNETTINEGNCSVGCVAVDIAEDIFPNFQQCRVLLIGAGDIGRVVAKTLTNRGVTQITIANRSFSKADDLAKEVGGTAIPLDSIDSYLGNVDIIVSGTGSPGYILHYHDVQELLEDHPQQRLLMVDIALPRDFDPEIGKLPNVLLKNLYDLKEIVERNVKQREQEIPKAQQMVVEEVQKFLTWKASLQFTPAIKALQNLFESIRSQEIEKYQRQFSEETLSQIDLFTKTLMKRYMHVMMSNLKSLDEVCELDARQLHIIQHLFDCQESVSQPNRCRSRRQQAKNNSQG